MYYDSNLDDSACRRRPARKCRAVAINYDEEKRQADASDSVSSSDEESDARSNSNSSTTSSQCKRVDAIDEVESEPEPARTSVALLIGGMRIDLQHTEGDTFLQCSAYALYENGVRSLQTPSSTCRIMLPSIDAVPHDGEGIADTHAFHTWIWSATCTPSQSPVEMEEQEEEKKQSSRLTRKRTRCTTPPPPPPIASVTAVDEVSKGDLTTVFGTWFLTRGLARCCFLDDVHHPTRVMLSAILHELVYEVEDDLLARQYLLQDQTITAAGMRVASVPVAAMEDGAEVCKMVRSPNSVRIELPIGEANKTTLALATSHLRQLHETHSETQQKKRIAQRCRRQATTQSMRDPVMRIIGIATY